MDKYTPYLIIVGVLLALFGFYTYDKNQKSDTANGMPSGAGSAGTGSGSTANGTASSGSTGTSSPDVTDEQVADAAEAIEEIAAARRLNRMINSQRIPIATNGSNRGSVRNSTSVPPISTF